MYIYILEGKIGRLELIESSNDIIGLCTDSFSSCNILVLISQDKKRYVLIHADQTFDEKTIREEMNWVGKNAIYWLCRRQHGYVGTGIKQASEMVRDKIMPNLKKFFKEIIVGEDKEVISIKFGEEDPVQSEELPQQTMHHPQAALLLVQHRIETAFSMPVILPTLLYDKKQWTPYSTIEISSYTSKSLTKIPIQSDMSAVEIFEAYFHKMINKDRGFAIHNSASLYVYYYLKKNSFDKKQFLIDSMRTFKKRMQIFPHYNYNRSKDEQFDVFITQCESASTPQKLIELGEEFRKRDDIEDTWTRDLIVEQIEVVSNSYLIFQKFEGVQQAILKPLMEGSDSKQDENRFSPILLPLQPSPKESLTQVKDDSKQEVTQLDKHSSNSAPTSIYVTTNVTNPSISQTVASLQKSDSQGKFFKPKIIDPNQKKASKTNTRITAEFSSLVAQLINHQNAQKKMNVLDGVVNVISIVYTDHKLANELAEALKNIGIENRGMPGQARKIEVVSASNNVETYSITLTEPEYDGLLGEGAYIALLNQQQMSMQSSDSQDIGHRVTNTNSMT